MCMAELATAMGSKAAMGSQILGKMGLPNANTPTGSAESSLFGPAQAADPKNGGTFGSLKGLLGTAKDIKDLTNFGGGGQQPQAQLPPMPGGQQQSAPTWESLQPQRSKDIDLATLLRMMGK